MDVASILGGNWVFRVEHKGITIHSSKVEGSEVLETMEVLERREGLE